MPIPETMQAALLKAHGGPEHLSLSNRMPVPSPAAGEVVVRVGAAGINNTDIWSREGAYAGTGQEPVGWLGKPLQFPRVQGGDVAGRIVSAGPGVPVARIGERVLVNALLYAEGNAPLFDARLLGSERDGGFAEFVTVPADNAHAIETDLSDAELATFPIAYLTALHMLNRARLSAGETLLVTGASGGVGSALIQLALARGARVIALTSAGKQSFIADLGACDILIRDAAPLRDLLRERGYQAVDVAADVVGGPLVPELLACLERGGRYVTAGAIAGPMVELDLRMLYLNHLELIGSTMGTQDEFTALVELIEQGRIRPLLAEVYPLSAIHRAQHDFQAKRFFGNLALMPDALAAC